MAQASGAYPASFFDELEQTSLRSARRIVPLLIELLRPASVVDVGCGRGVWLSVFREHGVDDILGLDGAYVDPQTLRIPQAAFRAVDLEQPFSMTRSFDLVLCFEVAEHLAEDAADAFVDRVVALGPVIAFSAAIPHQPGRHHVNTQWPHYWVARFAAHRLHAFDPIRLRVWEDADVDYWYAQNMLVFAHDSVLHRLPSLGRAGPAPIPSLVHPRRYLEMYESLSAALLRQQQELRVAQQNLADWERAYAELQETAAQCERACKPENMSLRFLLRAFPTAVVAAWRRRWGRVQCAAAPRASGD